MHIHKLEQYWFIAIAAVLGAFGAALFASILVFGVQVPTPVNRIDPQQISSAFPEPGLRDMGNNHYTAHFTAQTWFFTPKEIKIPKGAEVTFIVTSKDVTHGFFIEGHDVNMMLLPGQISQAITQFNRPGTYNITCHEYCGSAHQTMVAKIIVTE